eukprot:SAG11_NODE_5575_length_1519_cov_2.075352_3_plen_77_part_00
MLHPGLNATADLTVEGPFEQNSYSKLKVRYELQMSQGSASDPVVRGTRRCCNDPPTRPIRRHHALYLNAAAVCGRR